MDVTGRLEDSALVDMALSQDDADELYEVYPDLGASHLYFCPTCMKNCGEGVDGTVVVDGALMRCNCADQLQRYKHYLNAGIGLTYQRLNWNDYFGDRNAQAFVKGYIDALDVNMLEGRGFAMFGKAGTGKTMLASFALKEAVRRGIECYMTTAKDYIENTKRGWNNAKYAKWYKRKIDAARVLVLDDLGKEIEGGFGAKGADYAIGQIENLLRVRTQQSRPTIVTTNLSCPSGLETAYNKYVLSLFTESFDLVRVDGEDMREKARERRRGGRIW